MKIKLTCGAIWGCAAPPTELEVDATATVSVLKKRLLDAHGIDLSKEKFISGRGEHIAENSNLSESVEPDSRVFIGIDPNIVFVSMGSGSAAPHPFGNDELISEFKERVLGPIACMSTLRFHRLHLAVSGAMLENESRTLLEAGIAPMSVLLMKSIENTQLFFKFMSGKTVTLNLSLDDTILHTKEQIREKTAIPLESQILIYGQHQLSDLTKTLNDYEVQKYARVMIVERTTDPT